MRLCSATLPPSTEKELKRVESSPAFFTAQEGGDVVDHAEAFPQRAGSSGGLSSFSSSFSSNKNPIPQNRALQILQQQALESGLFKNPAFVKKERIRWQSLTVEEQQAQYDAICAVVQNFKNWLEGCEEKKSFSGRARARARPPTSRSASSNGARDEISGARSRNTNIDDKYTSSQKEEHALQEHGKSSTRVEIATSYPRGREKLRDWINELYESGLELLNETGSVLFIFTTLRPENHDDDHDGHHGGATEKSSSDLLNDDAFLRLDTLYTLAVFYESAQHAVALAATPPQAQFLSYKMKNPHPFQPALAFQQQHALHVKFGSGTPNRYRNTICVWVICHTCYRTSRPCRITITLLLLLLLVMRPAYFI